MTLRILYLVPCSPSGGAFGTRLRIRQIGAALKTIGTVETIVVGGSQADDEGAGDSRDSLLPVRRTIRLQPVRSRVLFERVRCGLDPTFIGYGGQQADQRARMGVLEDLPLYDLVWIYQLSTADALGVWHWPRSVLDINDVPSGVLHTRARHTPSLPQRLRAGAQIPVARLRERLAESRFTALSVCSDVDRDYLKTRRPVHVIPNGFPKPEREPSYSPTQPPRIGFIGIFEYPPNVDAVRWFLRECWPAIQRERPDARLRLIGKGSDVAGVLPPGAANVDALGWVDDPDAEMATWSAMIVPIRMGGGTRVKIAEAFSRKCPVVATEFGACGYGASDGREMYLTNSADGFTSACLTVMRDARAAAALADRAWNAFLEKWTWDAIAPRIVAASEDCLHRESQRARSRGAA